MSSPHQLFLTLCTALTLIAGSADIAAAHSPLTSTTPKNNSVIETVPDQLQLIFKGKIRLTTVTAQIADQSPKELDLSGHTGFESQISLPFAPLGGGEYLIEWRGLGEDGHIMHGEFTFTVK